MSFTFTHIIVTLKLRRDIDRDYFYGLRCAFDRSFRLSVGCSRSSCNGCYADKQCCYPLIFSQSLATEPLAVKRYQKPSCPFSFHFPVLLERAVKGTTVEIGLTLVGVAIEYHECFLKALTLTAQDCFSIAKAEAVDYAGNRYLVMGDGGKAHPDQIFIFSSAELQKTCIQLPATITIEILTPMRIMQQGRPLREITFSCFARALFRRVSSLTYYYEGVEMGHDFKWLSEQSKDIETLESSFVWTKWKEEFGGTRLSGVTGRATFSGNLDDFQIFLLLGQYLNLGKGATFGLGQYMIV